MSTGPPFESEPHVDLAGEHTAALARYEPSALLRIFENLGESHGSHSAKTSSLADAIHEHLSRPPVLGRRIAELAWPSRLVLGLLAVTERPVWGVEGLYRCLNLLGISPPEALADLLRLGLLALRRDDTRPAPADLDEPRPESWAEARLIAHPGALAEARTVTPPLDPSGPPCIERVRQVREADGLELILRLAALWQRVADSPLRETQQGTLYKRDRERLETDQALAGPIADMLEPIPDALDLWLALSRAVDLLVKEPGTDRIVAAPTDYWAENAIHLPQMLALRWLSLPGWHECGGVRQAEHEGQGVGPDVRPAILLRLASLDPDAWFAIDDLADDFSRRLPGWYAPTVRETPPDAPPAIPGASAAAAGRSRSRRVREAGTATDDPGRDWLRAILLGPAYQLGLVRVGEEDPSGRRVARLSDLGRYVLALGTPPPRPAFEHFLFVQPNFEIIAYRQGLNPALIGQFSRFARWSQLGSALELSLTPEDLYRGLEGGMTPQAILDRLARHSERPLPAGVAETIRTWAGRRERVAYHAAATLLEFATADDLEVALAHWGVEPPPARVSERLLLIEGEESVPFHRFRMLGARDYRRPAEVCVEVDSDGITLALDPNRSDLLVDAEIIRLADELPRERGLAENPNGLPQRRFRVTPRSLGRALDEGLGPSGLARWFRRRTGHEIPPAIQLLVLARTEPERAGAHARHVLVLSVESPEILDGLIQHPATRDAILERLGPRFAVVIAERIQALQRAMADLGLRFEQTGAP